jgi:predicted Ser/Thr protein kinase
MRNKNKKYSMKLSIKYHILSIILILLVIIFIQSSLIHVTKGYTGPIYIDVSFSHNPVIQNSLTTLNVLIYTTKIFYTVAPDYIDTRLIINSSLPIIYHGQYLNNLEVRLFKERVDDYYYLLKRNIQFLINASAPVGDYPIRVEVIYSNRSYVKHEVLSIRNPVEVTFNVSVKSGYQLDIKEFKVISKKGGVYTPSPITPGLFKVVVPEGEYDIIIEYFTPFTSILASYFSLTSYSTSQLISEQNKNITIILNSGEDIFIVYELSLLLFLLISFGIALLFIKEKISAISALSAGLIFYLSLLAVVFISLKNIQQFQQGLSKEVLTMMPFIGTIIYVIVLRKYLIARYLIAGNIKVGWFLIFNFFSLLLVSFILYGFYLRLEIVLPLWTILIIAPFLLEPTEKKIRESGKVRKSGKEGLDKKPPKPPIKIGTNTYIVTEDGRKLIKKDFKDYARNVLEDVMHGVTNWLQLRNIRGVPKLLKFDNENMCIFAEYIEGVNLREFIKKKGGKLKEEEASYYALKIAEIIKDVWESKKIVHRDLKPDNIIISWDEEVYIIDWEYSVKEGYKPNSSVGLKAYTPPEEDVSETYDVYSLGIILQEMITGTNYPLISFTTIIENQELQKLIRDMKNFNPKERPSIDEVVNRLRNITQSFNKKAKHK